MHSIGSVLPVVALIASAYCAPKPAPNPAPGLEVLRRALKTARSPLPQDVPFTIDEDYCFWTPDGECVLNVVAAKVYSYLELDPPPYDYGDYGADEGVYASDSDAYDAYVEVLADVYAVINTNAGYGYYDYDYETYIADQDDPLCVWIEDGDCWFNDMVKYVDDIWGVEDPYKKKGRSLRRQEDLSVYSTSDGIQTDYAEFLWDLLKTIDEHGPLDIDFSDK